MQSSDGKTKTFVQRVLREPLVHFLLAGALVFVAFGLLTGSERDVQDITVTRHQVEQLAATFSKTWQRPPSEPELKALIDDQVKDEIYVREALRLGLDQGDTVIRRRLRQKMEFMEQAEAAAMKPASGELEAFFEANRADFERPPKLALEQVFIDPRKHGAEADDFSRDVLNNLRTGADMRTLGDPTMLPTDVALSALPDVAAIFGPAFAGKVLMLPVSEWSGPVESEYGLHIVRVTKRQAEEVLALENVRDAVMARWRAAKQAELSRQRLEELLKTYNVKIDLSKDAQSQ